MDDLNRPLNRRLFHALLTLACCVYLLGLLVGPRVSDQAIADGRLWLENVRFTPVFGVSLNKDSFYYLAGTVSPRTVFEPFAIIQSRPLLAFLLKPVSDLLSLMPLPEIPGASSLFNALFPAYLSYLVFNLSSLIATLWLYSRVTLAHGVSHQFPATILLGTLLVANEVTKAFFFAAHTQMLNLLVPMLALIVLLGFREGASSRRMYFYTALLIGLLLLAYGAFIVAGAVLIMARLHRHIRGEESITRTMVDLVTMSALIALPYALWIFSVTASTGQFYTHEVARWRQVVWMFDVSEKGVVWLLSSLLANLVFQLRATALHIAPLALIAPLLIWFSWKNRMALKSNLSPALPQLFCAGVVAGVLLVFFSMVGYNVTRLAISPAVMCVVMAGIWCRIVESVSSDSEKKVLLLLVTIVMASQALWMIAKNGPYL